MKKDSSENIAGLAQLAATESCMSGFGTQARRIFELALFDALEQAS